ncbi:ABC transporter family substrate-binding protein [Rugosimonospora acidiphila]|uniref:ABC transporter family substrate-binding protein n=1 Tax=Rugosimonospora acidiphila TaxID=556531 RepID=UPI0031EE93F3
MLEKTIVGWNLNSADGNVLEGQEALDGITPTPFINTPDLQPTLNTDLMTSVTQTSSSPQTIVYKINPDAVWSDGTPINVDDFTYMWKTMNGVDCKTCEAATNSGYDQVKSVTGSDNGKTVTVVFNTPYTDWKGLFGPLYPAHLANQHGDLAASFKWLEDTQPTWSGGPFIISKYDKDNSITETANPKWYGKTKTSLDQLVFRIITDQTQEVPALQNNEVQAIFPQPDADIVNQIKQIDGVNSTVGIGLQWEHIDINLQNSMLKDLKLRTAIFDAIDTKQIIAKTVGQFDSSIQPLGNHNFLPGMNGYKDVVSSTGQGSGDIDKAKQQLTSGGYTGVGTALKTPSGQAVQFRCSFTQGNVLRQQTCELIQSELGQLGIKITPTSISDLGGTLSSGDYDLIDFAWVEPPFVFANAAQTWTSTSASNYGHWSNPQADALLKDASQQTDNQKAIDDLNQADTIMTNDAYVLPLYPKPYLLAAYANILNIRGNGTQAGPPYNDQEWGLATAS